MGTMPGNFMSQFKRSYHAKDDSIELYSPSGEKLSREVGSWDDADHMSVQEPMVLAAFIAFCCKEKHDVYLRGCTRNFRRSVPSLFRDVLGEPCDDEAREKRWSAYQALLAKLASELEGTRWDRNRLGAVLQHYGIRTPWLDVARNLYTVLWFANHEFETRGSCRVAVKSRQPYGWISLYQHDGLRPLRVSDLWDEHSSLHMRPHVQHGMSLARQEDGEKAACPDQDMNEYRIAQIRFPNSKQWRLHGHMYSTRFLFPAPEHDESLRQLKRASIQKILNEACGDLGDEAFGNVTQYC